MKRLSLLLLLALVGPPALSQHALSAEGHQIVYLNLTMVDGVVQLDQVSILPGKLKVPKSLTLVPGRILFTVLAEDQSRVYEGVVRDPSNIRYEFVDHDGQLKSKWVTSDSVSFSVRMPYHESIRSARFSIIPGTPGSTESQGKIATSLGAIDIDLKGDSDEE